MVAEVGSKSCMINQTSNVGSKSQESLGLWKEAKNKKNKKFWVGANPLTFKCNGLGANQASC